MKLGDFFSVSSGGIWALLCRIQRVIAAWEGPWKIVLQILAYLPRPWFASHKRRLIRFLTIRRVTVGGQTEFLVLNLVLVVFLQYYCEK